MNKQQLKALITHEPTKRSTRARPNYDDKYPEGLKSFVGQWLDQGLHLRIQEMCGPGKKLWRDNCDMRFVYYYNLVNTFLNARFEDQTMYTKVRDLPEEDRFLAVDCLGCFLGMNPHNGNIHLLEIVKRFKDLQL